jgi:hypothetical protein
MFLPIIAICFDLVIRRERLAWCWGFMFLLFAASILTPELALFVPCLFGVLFLHEIATRDASSTWLRQIPKTASCLAAGLVLTLSWVVYLLFTSSLGAFVEYFVVFAQGHNLEGSFPISWKLIGISLADFMWLTPTALWLLTIWWAVCKLRLRRPWKSSDWVMIAAALMSVIYFPKAIDRADVGHVSEAFCITILLLILWLIEFFDTADRAVESALVRLLSSNGRVRVVHIATGVAFVALIWSTESLPVTTRSVAARIPGDFHSTMSIRDVSTLPRLGYTVPDTVDTGQIMALQSVLNQYAGKNDPVFDYANEPGVLYYLLNRVPGTRYFYSAVTQTASAQKQEVDDLRKSRPPVVIFSDTTFGLLDYDGIPQSLRSFDVTYYLLQNYRPILNVQGQLVMLRNDLPGPTSPDEGGNSLYFDTPTCNFGDMANFSSMPNSTSASNTSQVSIAVGPAARSTTTTVSGWVVDTTGKPPSEVLAVVDDQVVATASPDIPRPDVVKSLNDPDAEKSGFVLSVPSGGPIQLYMLDDAGSAVPLPSNPSISRAIISPAQANSITDQGVYIPVVHAEAEGHVDGVSQSTSELRKLAIPSGLRLSDYQWLVLHGTFGASSLLLSDSLSPPSNQAIAFNLLPGTEKSVYVRVGSCLQWHGYNPSSGLFLLSVGDPLTPALTVKLAAVK